MSEVKAEAAKETPVAAATEVTTDVQPKEPVDVAQKIYPEKKEVEQPKVEEKKEDKPAEPKAIELKLPDGSLLSSSDVERISAYAKQKGLSQEQAQERLQTEHDAIKSFADNKQKAWLNQVEEWKSQSMSDKEIGGQAFLKSAEIAKKVITRFGTNELIDAVEKTGYGNHPELVRIFARIGKVLSSDTLEGTSTIVHAPKKSIAELLFPSMEKQQSKE